MGLSRRGRYKFSYHRPRSAIVAALQLYSGIFCSGFGVRCVLLSSKVNFVLN